MAIRLKVKHEHFARVKKLGALCLPDTKTWVLPDEITDINPFREWLPNKEGFFVQRPYFIARAKIPCFKCGQETTIIRLGAKFAQGLVGESAEKPVWEKWNSPVLFNEVDYLDREIAGSLKSHYPFFQKVYSTANRGKIWGSTCIHCQALQEEDDGYRYEANPLSPVTLEEAREIRIVYFKMAFDYFIRAGQEMNALYAHIID